MESLMERKVQYLNGVGPVKVKALARLNIFKTYDLITYYPRRYEERGAIKKICDINDGEVETIMGIVSTIIESKPRRGLHILKVSIGDGSGYVHLTWFNQAFLKKNFAIGMKMVATGKVNSSYRQITLNNVEYETIEDIDEERPHTIIPVYSINEAITQKFLRNLIEEVLLDISDFQETIPLNVIKEYKLMHRFEAIKQIHFPESQSILLKARNRLAFEELYFIQCGLLLLKSKNKDSQNGIRHLFNSTLMKNVLSKIPFKLTSDQEKVLQEITFDMESSIPMQRLLQGDVGSGKTIIAALALTKTVENGYQGALMVPTEILAEQHYQTLNLLLKDCGIKIALLIGKLTKKNHDIIIEKIRNGDVDIIIGTHALIQADVVFKNIGLVVTDEQHRFGVKQRELLKSKGSCPDMLVMTATPIPRTMTLTVYGDLDVSLIKQLPPGRKPIKTFVRQPDKRNLIYDFVLKQILEGRQAYVVCPLIEVSENIDTPSVIELFDELRNGIFKRIACGLIHGKLPNKEKEIIMDSFYRGEIKLLVATTVIEVGVNVPNASIMVIEGAERFGLAQLHQLRGRIGRGKYQSYCILLTQSKTIKTKERLLIMEKTSDGFILAEEDLKLRGPGQFFGVRQHGLPDLKIANILSDVDILLKARAAALKTINNKKLLSQISGSLAQEYKEHFINFTNN